MNKTIQKALDSWERQVRLAHNEGKGRYADLTVRDIIDYIHIIELIKLGQYKEASNIYCYILDTWPMSLIPSKIGVFLEKNN